jgi:hypothetical protein
MDILNAPFVQIQTNVDEIGPSYGRPGPHMAQETNKEEIKEKPVTSEKDNDSFSPHN